MHIHPLVGSSASWLEAGSSSETSICRQRVIAEHTEETYCAAAAVTMDGMADALWLFYGCELRSA